jgi:hypothetical protein
VRIDILNPVWKENYKESYFILYKFLVVLSIWVNKKIVLKRACSSVVEQSLDKREVIGSIPF